ncbi:class I SAM-dependent methyltransferase [Plantactinospora sp. S1510]|uniref:Class I SAM-dependent methyltransferase n=1 Tax=Plantactinospora alkalitolerans TaxID=2789879 RepID=A0ABS0H3J7_9ACTN|nr:class I SAM-dependent methyltransferase [Plantactinospora alkalitolerans]MBF9133040.1 class I SAM-dependent methyltransferase [Plantactinospora alkalitolerans]
MTTTPVKSGYAFDNRSPEAEAQMRALEAFLDPITADRLAPILTPGATCWELGAGGGSIARLMSRVVGPGGRVIATDIEPSRLNPAGNLDVRQHDVRTGAPEGGPFDVIHARLVLLHLPERRRVLAELIGALAPGGWLVVEEFDCTAGLRVLAAPTDDAAKLFQQVMEATLGILQDRGADLAWAQDVHTEMVLAGLTDVDTITHSQSWPGGSAGASLHETNSRQLEPRLLATGLSPNQLAGFRELANDPSFASLSYQFVSTRGRRPGRGSVN